MNDIKIVLINGIVIPAKSFGKRIDVVGDFIFNTSLVGYQEVLTDPSYFQEIVVMTFPLQGIYGINLNDSESLHSSPSAFVVCEYEENYSNNHAEMSLNDYLIKRNIQGVSNVDTRYLTKLIRENGSLIGKITDINSDENAIIDELKKIKLSGHVHSVSIKNNIVINPELEKHVVLVDFGAKDSIAKNIASRGYKVTIVPWDTKSNEIEKLNPDIIFLSNGPGDPAELTDVIHEIKQLINNGNKVCGICLGHQLIAWALGAQTYRLKFGHHSINHPVIDVEDNKVFITSQNHNYTIDESTIPTDIKVTMRSLHDNTIEGIAHKNKKVISVQFHPEAAPGPNDANEIFDRFIKFLEGDTNA